MNRIVLVLVALVLSMLIVPSLATAQVPGIKLVNKDAPLEKTEAITSGQIVVGKDLVATFTNETSGRPSLFGFDGSLHTSLPRMLACHSGVFAGEHLYLATGVFGLNALETKSWQTVQNISGPRMNGIGKLAATPEGKQVLTMHGWPLPTLTVYDRDAKTGKLTKSQVFQADDASLAEAKIAQEKSPPGAIDLTIDKKAVRVPNFSHVGNMEVSADGKFLFVVNYAMSVSVFDKDEQGWKYLCTLADNVDGRHRWGLQFCLSALPVGEHVFVGGIRRLAMLDFDGKKLTSKGKFWVDDSEPAGHQYETVPYLDMVLSLAASPNGKYLFVAAADDGGLTVLKIVKDDLELVGRINDSPAGSKMLEVHCQGNRLFAKTTNNPLLIYDLDETFTK